MSDAEPPPAGASPPSGAGTLQASAKVAHILRSAERAADDLMRDTEEKADARIAEAVRAADNRVRAAEEEAAEILADAKRQAAVLHETAQADAARIREEAERRAAALVGDATQRAEEVQRIAEVYAEETRERAATEATTQVRRARDLAGEVLGDGTEMSHHLRQLSDSLRRNAETLLRDVMLAHRALTDRIEASGIEASMPASHRDDLLPPSKDFADIPEFIPASPRRR